MKKALIFFLMLIFCGCSYGKGYIKDDIDLKTIGPIAVLPFDNLTDHPKAGIIVSQILTTELYSRKKLNILEETQIKKIIKEKKIDSSTLMDTYYVQKIGNILGAGAVIVGSVSEYGYRHDLDEEPVVGINVRMIDTKTGSVLWASSHTKTGGWFGPNSLNKLTQNICHSVAKEILR